ncbi:MAG: nitroreductase [Cryomorphaceae bacterium]|jgi:nitroreductase
MDALTALHTRNSVNLLCEPGPTQDQLNNIFRAGLRACDHKDLRPWKFLTIEGEARSKFGRLMADVKEMANAEPLSKDLREKLKAKPFRAPLIIAVVAKIIKHEKVPEIEQVLSAAASAQMMMTAAHAQGVGAIWRSGSMMFQPEMLQGLGLDKTDQIVGFLYLGSPRATKALPELDPKGFVRQWNG